MFRVFSQNFEKGITCKDLWIFRNRHFIILFRASGHEERIHGLTP